MSKKRVTSFDVASLAGVSRSVVSAVLNGTRGIGVSEEKREEVLAAIRELNYHVDAQARGMKTGRSRCIAASGNTEQPMFLQLLSGIQHACAARGYYVLIFNQNSSLQERSGLIDLHLQKKIDGVLTLDEPSYSNPKWSEAVLESGLPYISVEGYAESDEITSIYADYRQSILDALNYMQGKINVRPYYLELYEEKSRESKAERSRLEAYKEWCVVQGIEPVVVSCNRNDGDSLSLKLQSIMKKEHPPVILANWSDGAIAAYRMAWELGLRVGTDAFIMSADNTYRINRQLVPSMSVMDIPYREMGEKAVEALLQQIETVPEKRHAEKIRVNVRVVPGESV